MSSHANVRFNHLLLTKFNILTTLEYGPLEQRLDSEWLRARLVEFETFCLPSVAGQVGADFRWVVFCDEASPDWFKQKMRSFGDVLIPLFVSGMTNATMGQRLKTEGLTDERPLISTRLDNDDAIARDYLSNVQSHFANQDRLFVDYPIGLRACEGALFSGLWRSNPFMSLIEASPDNGVPYLGVYFKQHHKVRKTEQIKTVWHSPVWLRAMHSANTVQTQVGIPRLSSQDERFSVDWAGLKTPPSLSKKVSISLLGYKARLERSSKYKTIARRFSKI
ncbi:glycosyltransferase [Subtercola boreus]|nr:glycosyltransferase [Subtercola boreus]